MRGSGCAAFETTTTRRPVSGAERVAGSTVTSNLGACAGSGEGEGAAATSATAHAALVKRIDIRRAVKGMVNRGVWRDSGNVLHHHARDPSNLPP